MRSDFMSKLVFSEEQEDQVLKASVDEELEFTVQDLEKTNTQDAKAWLNEDAMLGLVSESEGGIIGYIHEAHAETIATALNLQVLNKENH